MAGSSEIFVFKDALIILGTAAVVAPVVHRLKISPVLGFFAVGAALGPHGLGRLADYSRAIDWLTVTGEKQIAFIADLGIVFLLFFIGLELSMRRLLTMRRLVFGLGGLQGLLTTLVISFGALWFGQPPAAALIIGACLALSSTALVMEVLSGQRRMMSTTGRSSFAILLAQDLAVVPLLFLIGALGRAADSDLGGPGRGHRPGRGRGRHRRDRRGRPAGAEAVVQAGRRHRQSRILHGRHPADRGRLGRDRGLCRPVDGAGRFRRRPAAGRDRVSPRRRGHDRSLPRPAAGRVLLLGRHAYRPGLHLARAAAGAGRLPRR